MKTVAKFMIPLAIAGCAGNRKTISERPLVEATMSDDATAAQVRDIEQSKPGPEFYVKKKELKVKPVRRQNSTGSLSSVGDARSYVLPTTLPIAVGTLLDIKMTSNRLDQPAATPSAMETSKSDDKSSAQLEQTLLKALPNLDPKDGDKDKPTLVKSFKAQVIDIRENGDMVVAYHRRSLRADQAADLLIKAVVPHSALTERDNITTAKLEDVELRESQDGEIIERISSNWEDEYTLRMSGFDEAKSKSALALEDQRRQIKDTREKVVAQIKSLGQERQTITKERQDLLDKKKQDDEKIAELEQKLKDRDEEIDKLKPKEEEETPAESSDNKDDKKNAKADPKSDTKLAEAKAKPDKATVDPKKAVPAKTDKVPAKANKAQKTDKAPAVAKADPKKTPEAAKK